jgi:hypothetical protein
MIRPTDENQSFSQAAHGYMVDLCLFHLGVPQASACFVASICISRSGTSKATQLGRNSVPGHHGCRCQEDLCTPRPRNRRELLASTAFVNASMSFPVKFLAVMMYIRYPLSLRQAENLLWQWSR